MRLDYSPKKKIRWKSVLFAGKKNLGLYGMIKLEVQQKILLKKKKKFYNATIVI